MPQDYYLVLGITADASQTDIKDAYRRLAKAYHPDHYKGSHQTFQAIQEAYSVLSDPARRRRHDSRTGQRKAGPRQTRVFSQFLEPLVPEPSSKPFSRQSRPGGVHPYHPFSRIFSRSYFSGPGPAAQQVTIHFTVKKNQR